MEGSIHPTCSSAHTTRTMKFLTLVWLATAAAAEDQCDGPLLQLQLRNSTDAPPRTLYGVLATFGGIPLFNATEPAQLVAAEPLNACSPLPQTQGADTSQLSPCMHAPSACGCCPGNGSALLHHLSHISSAGCRCCAVVRALPPMASRRGLPSGAWQLLVC